MPRNTRKLTARERNELQDKTIVPMDSSSQGIYDGNLVRENAIYAFYEKATYADKGYYKTNAWIVLQKPSNGINGIIVLNGFHDTIPASVYDRYDAVLASIHQNKTDPSVLPKESEPSNP